MNLYSIPPILSFLCFLGLATLTLMRRLKTTVNILFFMICLLGIFLYLDILIIFHIKSENAALIVSRLDHIFVVYTIPIFIHFFHAYLGISKRKWLVYCSYGYAFILMWFAFTPLCIKKMNVHPFGFYGEGGGFYLLIGLGAGFAVFYSISLLIYAIQNEKRSIQKNKLKYILAGFGTLGVLNGLNVLPLLGYTIYPPGAFSFIPLIIFSVGLFKYDLLDMGTLIKKSLLYSIITAVFTCVYALIITIANDAFRSLRFSESIFFLLVFFFFVAVVFSPTQSLVQKLIDNLFRRERLNFHESIQDISRLIVSSLEIDAITARLTTSIGTKMQIEHVALFLENKKKQQVAKVAASRSGECINALDCIDENTAVRHFSKKETQPILKKHLMERSDEPEIQQVLSNMENLCAEIIFPLTVESRCIGFMTLGEKKSGSLYTREEINLLFTLSVQLSLAIENAQTYRRLDDLNRNLEDRVQQRTLALQKALSEKEKSQEQLIRSESLAAIGQLVSGVAHELNNPLSAAISLIQSVNEDLDTKNDQGTATALEDRLKGDIVFAEKELIRMKEIVASLLGLSRQTHTYTEAVNINGVIHDALKVLQGYIRQHGITIKQAFGSDLPPIQGNFANLGQVAINIIKNGCQAVPSSKGILHVSTQYLKDTKQVVFSCRDNGTGIPEFIRKDIFKPFFTTKSVGHGTGLGLYICHEIIRKHQGIITHENIQGNGVLFRVVLPVRPLA